jgi:uncharacterized UPF0160 family protein
MPKDIRTVVAHNGDYHLDDICAVAILNLWAQSNGVDLDIQRTRDDDAIADADIVIDVGGVYDITTNRFDHHQNSFSEVRENGVPYASCGLVWKQYGLDLCSGDARLWSLIDAQILAPIDAVDSGMGLMKSVHPSGITDITIHSIVSAYKPTWKELLNNKEGIDSAFFATVSAMQSYLQRSIVSYRDYYEGVDAVRSAYTNARDKKIIELDIEYPWEDVLSEYSEPLLVIYHRKDGSYGIKCVRAHGHSSFQTRISFPESWRGVSGEDLIAVSGIHDAVFCHKAGFLLVVGSRQSAILVAQNIVNAL